jgi:serine/threonine-protein kinase
MIDNQLVMIMEYVEGTTLAARVAQAAISWRDAANYIDQVLAALGYAHKQNVIHRDIKPANMMLMPSGAIKLMDFGIARSGNDVGLTVIGTTVGSLAYMSPEQVKCEPIDARSDLYSLGVSLYEMVTGQIPFKGDSNFSIMQAQLQQTPRPPIEVKPDLPEPLNQIILMAMAKEPARRFQSADAFRNALKGVAASLGTKGATLPVPSPFLSGVNPMRPAAPTVQMPPPQASGGGHRGLYMTLGALIVMVVLVAAGFSAPHWFKTRASGGAASHSTRYEAAQPATEAAGTQQVTPESSVVQSASDMGISNPPAVPPPAQQSSPDAASVTTSAAKPGKMKKLPSQPPGGQQAESQPSTQLSGGQQVESQASTQPPRPDPAQIAELDHEMDQITSREAAVKASLDSLQRAQSAQGLQLRGDIVAAQQRMQTYAAKAQSALQAQDIENTKKYLELMETELGKIEKFLGH